VQLQVQFNKAINGVTLGNVLLSQNGNNILITPQLSGDKTTLTLLLKQPLNTNTQYTLTVQGVQDTSGNALAAASTVSFTTGGSADLLSGALVNYSPSNGANNVPLNSQIVLTFNDIINPLSLNGNGIWLRDSSNNNVQIAVTNALSSDGKTLTLTPSSALPANHNYYLFINWYNFNYPVIDDSGNSLAGNYFSFNSAAQ
jgi:methionine-rich copper-binding protein CopC